MSRRRKSNPAEDLLELLAWMPWWVVVVLAIGTSTLPFQWAGQPVTAAGQLRQVGSRMTGALWRTLTNFGRYILPSMCLVRAGTSVWRRNELKHLVAEVGRGLAADVLDGVGWDQFENLVGEGFRLQGYRVSGHGGGGADGGVGQVRNK